jgi:hypothetical protein
MAFIFTAATEAKLMVKRISIYTAPSPPPCLKIRAQILDDIFTWYKEWQWPLTQ